MKQLKPNSTVEAYSPRFVCLACFFVSCLMIANIIAGKLITVLGVVLPAAVILFPVVYILGDILTEVYGFQRSRLVIWLGFGISAFMALISLITINLPYPDYWEGQSAFQVVLGSTPRFVLASLAAYFVGEFVNAAVLSRLKVVTKGRWLWLRTISSSVVGQALDSSLFISIAFLGILPPGTVWRMIIAQYLFKLGYEILVTPLTYWIVGWVKQREGTEIFDHGVRYNPFKLRVGG